MWQVGENSKAKSVEEVPKSLRAKNQKRNNKK